MNITLEPGTYVVAVSGGVDSVALLHALHKMQGLRLTVAHFDHGIRPDSNVDAALVRNMARRLSLPFVVAQGNLGAEASEAEAREARYKFLRRVRQAANADAIVMAHHKDDVLETAIINLSRGTGRKGLTSLKSIDGIKRPLLQHTKKDIYDYAENNKLKWREDSTNTDTAYLRNHVRHNIVPKLSAAQAKKLHKIIQTTHVINAAIDELIGEYLQRHSYKNRLKRHEFVMLPHNIALEVMASWLRSNNIRTFDKNLLERLTHAAKIHSVGKLVPVSGTVNLRISGDFLALSTNER